MYINIITSCHFTILPHIFSISLVITRKSLIITSFFFLVLTSLQYLPCNHITSLLLFLSLSSSELYNPSLVFNRITSLLLFLSPKVSQVLKFATLWCLPSSAMLLSQLPVMMLLMLLLWMQSRHPQRKR